jgi:hypothetical protein
MHDDWSIQVRTRTGVLVARARFHDDDHHDEHHRG